MKKYILSIALLAVIGFNSAAIAAANIAVVDIQAVVNKSAQVQALKKEQKAKTQELEKWLKTAQEDVKKQQTEAGKEKLLKKYNADFEKKKADIVKNYQTKLQAIDKSITETITNEAKAKGYDMVLTKQGAVLYGGIDITNDLIKVVK